MGNARTISHEGYQGVQEAWEGVLFRLTIKPYLAKLPEEKRKTCIISLLKQRQMLENLKNTFLVFAKTCICCEMPR